MLEVNKLTVYYDKALALEDVNIHVGKGEIVTVLGPNGAGKTTLLRAISGLVKAKGNITFNQKRIDGLPPHEIVRLGIVHCPERRRVFPEMSVLDNLMLGAYLRGNKKDTIEDLERVYSLFPVLKERSNQIAKTLSGGEQQMLAIGRALMSRPKILMLDEPSLGLAPILQESIFKSINEIARSGVSILLVEQNVHQALNVADRGYVLKGGHIVTSGDKHEIMKDDYIKTVYLSM